MSGEGERWGWRGTRGVDSFKLDDEMFCNYHFHNRTDLKGFLNSRREQLMFSNTKILRLTFSPFTATSSPLLLTCSTSN